MPARWGLIEISFYGSSAHVLAGHQVRRMIFQPLPVRTVQRDLPPPATSQGRGSALVPVLSTMP
jgi:hypothetical protein